MKDQEFFLNTKFGLHNVQESLAFILSTGWIVKTNHRAVEVSVTIYENKKEKKQKNHMCKTTSSSFEKALVLSFIEIQEFYKRVLA